MQKVIPEIYPKNLIDKSRTAAFTGHRKLIYGVNTSKLKEVIKELITSGINTFLIGMAKGFDSLCFEVLLEFKKEYDINIVAVVPCLNQTYKFTEKEKEKYEKLLSFADDKVLIRKEYTVSCMHLRNRYMVDNCSYLVAYLRENKGGTFYTVKYAENENVTIIRI